MAKATATANAEFSMNGKYEFRCHSPMRSFDVEIVDIRRTASGSQLIRTQPEACRPFYVCCLCRWVGAVLAYETIEINDCEEQIYGWNMPLPS